MAELTDDEMNHHHHMDLYEAVSTDSLTRSIFSTKYCKVTS